MNRGIAKLRWTNGEGEDLRKLGIKGWWMVARDRKSWRKILGSRGCSIDDDDYILVVQRWQLD